jgi:hypothetical protein
MVAAEIAWSWHGSDHPDSWDDTESELTQSRRRYRTAIRGVTSRARTQGYYAAIAALLRSAGGVTPPVRELFHAGSGVEHADAADRELFLAVGLLRPPNP